MSWKALMSLSKIFRGECIMIVKWMEMGLGKWHDNILIYILMSRRNSIAKSCVGGDRLVICVVAYVIDRSHSHSSLG